jgi:two-component system chemotaxis response regulator CheY
MRFLIVEDDFASRRVLQKFLAPYGESEVAVNGLEALAAIGEAIQQHEPYALICLDIMMPELDGQEVLKQIRAKEAVAGIHPSREMKIVMTTALDSPREVVEAYYRGGCNGYLVKPISRPKLHELLKEFGIARRA